MKTKLEISRGPRGLRLHLPSGRTLDVSATAAGATFIERMLRDADEYDRRSQKTGYIREFPTQAILDTWASREEIDRQVEAVKERKVQERKDAWAARGVDLDKVEFKL